MRFILGDIMFIDGIIDQIDRISEPRARLELYLSSEPVVRVQGTAPRSTKYDMDVTTDSPRPGAEGIFSYGRR